MKNQDCERVALAILAAVVVGLLVSSCGAPNAPQPVHSKDDRSEKLLIGGVFTLSGPESFLGTAEKLGIEMAIEQFMKGECIDEAFPAQPCEGGGVRVGDEKTPIEFKVYDDESDNAKAVAYARKLVQEDKANIVFGPRMNEAVVEAGAVLEKAGVVQVSAIASSPALVIGRKLGIQITDSGVIEKHIIGRFLNESGDVLRAHNIDPSFLEDRTRTAIIARDELYSVHGAYGWAEEMQKGSRHFQFDRDKDLVLYPHGTTDFAPFVKKLAERKPDIVLLDSYVPQDMLAIMLEMIKQGLDFQTGRVVLVGNDVLSWHLFMAEAEKAGLNLFSGYVWSWQEQSPGVERPELAGLFDQATLNRIKRYGDVFEEKYRGTGVESLGPSSRGAFDATMWVLFGIEKACTIADGQKIADAIKSLDLDSLRGPGQQFYRRPDTGEATGQLFVTEYIMGFRDGRAYYTGIKYHGEPYYGPWVYGDKLLN